MRNTFSIFVKILVLLVLCSGNYVFSQTPQYYNYQNSGSSTNNFPFNVNTGKAVNMLFLAGDFNQPAPLPTGKSITKVYFYTVNAATRTFTDLRILLAQDTITSFSNDFYSGTFDTVYYNPSATLTSTALGWMSVELDHPFPYDPSKTLIMFVGQCSSSGTAGMAVRNITLTGGRRDWSVGGCPFVSYGMDAAVTNFGVDVVSSTPPISLPDMIYYKFKDNPSLTQVKNFAVPGVGNAIANIASLTLSAPGQFDSCLSGTATSSAKITTGYSLSTGTSSFTISMWLNNLPTPATTRYLFGDLGPSFRCFVGGVAPTNGAILRGTGVTDVNIPNIFPGPTVIHIVYDSATSTVKIYKNGVFSNSVVQAAPFNFTNGTGFTVGGYSTSAGLEGLMDEFRFYKRALDSSEIAATWNVNLGNITAITPVSTQIPETYSLSQNYPNPFNPVTKINFEIAKQGLVTLKVFDMLGRQVSELINGFKPAGQYSVDFNAANLSSGVYLYRLEVNGYSNVKKMILIK